MPDIEEISQQVYESILNCDQIQKVSEHEEHLRQLEEKTKELDSIIVKLQEDSEGRDGLLLQ